MTRYLTLEDLLTMIEDLAVGPVSDLGLLESAAHRPTTTLWGREVYPTIDEKAAALLQSLVTNHPLIDGNKRLGWLAVVVFYALNGVRLEAPDDAAYDLVISVATRGSDMPDWVRVLSEWHEASSAP